MAKEKTKYAIISTGDFVICPVDTPEEVDALEKKIKNLGDSTVHVLVFEGVLGEVVAPKPSLGLRFGKHAVEVNVTGKISSVPAGHAVATIIGD